MSELIANDPRGHVRHAEMPRPKRLASQAVPCVHCAAPQTWCSMGAVFWTPGQPEAQTGRADLPEYAGDLAMPPDR